jgi:hypothetical protein
MCKYGKPKEANTEVGENNEDDDEDFGIAQNGGDGSSMLEGTTNGATHSKLHLNGNTIEVRWKSVTEKHLLTWDAGAVATFIQEHYMAAYNVVTTIHCCTEYVQQKV